MTKSLQTCTLLVIEDDPAYLENIELILRMEGFRVLKASCAESALALLHNEIPDLILCDILMPKMDGHTFFSNQTVFQRGVSRGGVWTAGAG